jgi:hypothetical protein
MLRDLQAAWSEEPDHAPPCDHAREVDLIEKIKGVRGFILSW